MLIKDRAMHAQPEVYGKSLSSSQLCFKLKATLQKVLLKGELDKGKCCGGSL